MESAKVCTGKLLFLIIVQAIPLLLKLILELQKKKKKNIIILKFVKQWKVVYFDTLI